MSQINVNTIADSSGSNSITQSSIGRFYTETDTDISGSAYKEWTNIPSWADRIVVTVAGMNQSTNAIGGSLTLRAGTGGSIVSSSYVASSGYIRSGNAANASYDTTGFWTYFWTTSNDRYGSYELFHMGSNKWICKGLFASSASSGIAVNSTGYVGLSGVLDTIRVGSYNNTVTHTGSFVSIMYQGK